MADMSARTMPRGAHAPACAWQKIAKGADSGVSAELRSAELERELEETQGLVEQLQMELMRKEQELGKQREKQRSKGDTSAKAPQTRTHAHTRVRAYACTHTRTRTRTHTHT